MTVERSVHEDFWQARWARNQIGFHLKEANPYLLRHWPRLELALGTRVLVPLCGKSLDMAWLAGQGYRVLGVELAEKAAEDFFAEQGLVAETVEQGAFKVYRAGALEIWCGDFFALGAEDAADCLALYDRAALIALPPEVRRRYAEHLNRILPAGCRGMLITLDYEQEKMEGPPFSVAEDEVRRLFNADWEVQALEKKDVLGKNWRFEQYGLKRTDEDVYRLAKLR